MIIDNSTSNIEVVGDIKEFKTSIDPKNLEFITTLLSSNLYSNPEQSFIREIVSNAWDSHVEAGNTDTPVIIKFTTTPNYSITIRDYGTGLSPERFAEVYCNIGSSTKRESNEFIGGFGIGKYSSLACTNTVYITSYYNGMAYYYIMLKSGNAITTNLLKEVPTTEKNGVEITIRNIYDFIPYKKALDYIVFFPNIYIEGVDTPINNSKIKRFTNFSVSSLGYTHRLLLGNVLYPIDSKPFPTDIKDFLQRIRNSGIVINFNVGELNITPNRENVIYTENTINKITNRIRAAKSELDNLVSHHLCKDYTNIEDYCNVFYKSMIYNPIDDTLYNNYQGYTLQRSDFVNNITFKGKDLSGTVSSIRLLLSNQIPSYKGVIYNDKFYTASTKVPYSILSRMRLNTPKILICKNTPRLLSSIKSYIKENYDSYTIVGEINKADLNDIIKRNSITLSTHKDLIIDALYDALIAKSKSIDFTTDKDYLEYKKNLSPSGNKVKSSQIILYTYFKNLIRTPREFHSLEDAVQYIKSLKKGVILSNMLEDDSFWLEVAKIKNLEYIKANKDIINYLRDLNLKCVVDMGWLLREDPLINKVHTVIKYISGDSILHCTQLHSSVDEDLYYEFSKIYRLLDLPSTYKDYCVKIGEEDAYTKNLCLKLNNYSSEWHKARTLVQCSDHTFSQLLTEAIILKTKAYRISYKAYRKIKNNELLNILCKR